MRFLSLFDGIACGMVALERAGIPVERYVAYEIEPNAIKVSKHNYPMIEQKGDVFKAEYTEGEFDILIGGSPCTHWSIAKAGYGRETTSSGVGWELFMQYVRALREAKPKWFLYENNESMSDAIKDEITKQLRVEPIMIDSADFSAQHRKRLYWTNIPVNMQYEKSDLLFEDIMEKEGNFKYRDFSKFADTVKISKDGLSVRYDTSGKGHYGQGNRAKKPNQKWNTLPAAGSNTKNDIWVDKYVSRHLLPVEMERLQTLPDGYTSCLNSDIKSMRCCGNGWTVDVIAHIFTCMKKQEEKEKEMELKVKTPTFPEVIEFNFEELKQEITERASAYVNLVYTDDQIADAKKDRATLNKFVKVLSDERIKIKKECLKPYEDFEAKIKELDSIVGKAIKNIDDQVKGYEEQKKQDKLAAIKGYWEACEKPFDIALEKVLDQKWLNASISLKSVYGAIDVLLEQFTKDLSTLENLPEFSFEAIEVYKTTLNINSAISEGHRLSEIQKRKAEYEAEYERLKAEAEYNSLPKTESFPEDAMNPPEVPTEEAYQWLGFKAYLTVTDAQALGNFMRCRGIQFEQIEI